MTTLRQAHTLASAYWDTKGGTTGTVMAMRAAQCVKLAKWGWDRKVSTLTPSDGTHLLTALSRLSASSKASYYLAFRRMLALSGSRTEGWPQAGKVPRRVREPMARAGVLQLREWMEHKGWSETADLIDVLLGTGMRVKVEALDWDALTVLPGDAVGVIGKGGHERVIPVSTTLYGLVGASERMAAMRRLSYAGHLRRWNAGVEVLGLSSKLPTPHSVRHLYATEAYARSGRNLRAVQELLGHADINTTARYIGVDMEELREAAGA